MSSTKGKSSNKANLNRALLLELLQDAEVNKQLRALIAEILGADNGRILLEVLAALQNGGGEGEPQPEQPSVPVKKQWWKKVLNVALSILPFVFKIVFKGKAKK